MEHVRYPPTTRNCIIRQNVVGVNKLYKGLLLQNIDFGNILTKIKLELILSNVAVLFATDIQVGELQVTQSCDYFFCSSKTCTSPLLCVPQVIYNLLNVDYHFLHNLNTHF